MENFNNIPQHLEIIEDIFIQEPEDREKLLSKLDLTEKEFEDLKSGQIEPDKIQLENIYNFSYNAGLYLNEIVWLDRLDEFRNENSIVASHGSRTNIKGNIRLDLSGESNDFGNGFYIGEDIAQAGMWVGEEPNSSIYILTFDEKGLDRAQFNVSVDWMLAVCYYRDQIPQYANSERILKIRDKVDNCDYIYAPIADNKLFEVIDAFVAEEITDLQCLYALSATHLGYQYVLKTEKALNNLKIIDHLYFSSVEKSLYNKESDIENNTSLHKAFIAKKRYKDQGQYISELLGDSSLKVDINPINIEKQI